METEEKKKDNRNYNKAGGKGGKYAKNGKSGKNSAKKSSTDNSKTGGENSGSSKPKAAPAINKLYAVLLIFLIGIAIVIAAKDALAPPAETPAEQPSIAQTSNLPEFRGKNYAELNNNVPSFTDDELKAALESYEKYGELDKYGRCTAAVASLSKDTMPAEEEDRGDISEIHPSGWRRNQGWERMHLIAWNLSAENANKKNLVTGTHYCNYDGMRPLEIKVADYILDTGNHVLYRVTPVYKGKDLIPYGIQMEAQSIEDEGRGIKFNVFVFNVTPGKNIDYVSGVVTDAATGEMEEGTEIVEERTVEPREYVVNKRSMVFHYPSCEGAKQASSYNKETVTATRQELIDQGYEPCSRCEP